MSPTRTPLTSLHSAQKGVTSPCSHLQRLHQFIALDLPTTNSTAAVLTKVRSHCCATEGFSSHPPGHTHAQSRQHTCTQPTHCPPHPRELPLSWLPHTSPFCSQPYASYSSLYSLNSCFPRRVFPNFQVRVHVPSCHPLV